VESDKEREAATAATAKDEEKRRGEKQQRRSRSCSRHVRFAKLFGEEAAQAMRLRPTRCPPDVVLETPYDADPQYHQDWTIVKGSNYDPEAWAREKQLREQRNILIRESLTKGKSVFYKSSGNSMWPLVQSGDGCWFHPIRAVTATDASSLQKEASDIGVGDIVFCQVRPSGLFYAHIVHAIQSNPPEYQIGNIEGCINGCCHREHIFGILIDIFRCGRKESIPRARFRKRSSRRWRC